MLAKQRRSSVTEYVEMSLEVKGRSCDKGTNDGTLGTMDNYISKAEQLGRQNN